MAFFMEKRDLLYHLFFRTSGLLMRLFLLDVEFNC